MNYVEGYIDYGEGFSDQPFKYFFETGEVQNFWGDDYCTYIMFYNGVIVKVDKNCMDFLYDMEYMKRNTPEHEQIRNIFLN